MPLARVAAPVLAVSLLRAAQASAEDAEPVDVVVQGDRMMHHDRGRDATAATYVVQRADLRAPGATVADALLPVPGVQIARSGASSDLATAAVRGATSAQTPVYLAGIRLNDDLTGTADLSTVPIFMLDRIEVYRGNAPFDADRLGLGGAIFLEPALPSASHVGGGLGVGSFGEIGTWARGSVRSGDSTVGVSVRRDALKNDYPYVDDNGTRFNPGDDVQRSRANADAESYDAWGIARLSLGREARLLSLANVFTREQGVTGLSVIPAAAARLRSHRALGAISATVPCRQAADPGCAIELVTTGLTSGGKLTDPLRELTLGSSVVDSRGQRFSQQERMRYDLGSAAAFTLASSQEGERLDIDTAEAPAARTRRGVVRGAGTLLVRPSASLTLQALGALECNATRGPGRDSGCETSPSGRLGLAIAPANDWKISANVGRYVRSPTLGELYGVSASLRSNPLLATETGWTGDIGLAWSRHAEQGESWSFYAELFAFARLASQLISYRRTSFSGATPYNVDSARILGTELAAGATAFGALRAEISATALDPRDTSAGRSVENDLLRLRSRLTLSPYVELYAEPTDWLGLDRASLGARAFYRSAEVADDAGLVIIDAQTSVDTEINLSFLRRRLVFRGRIADMFDARLFDIVGYPLPGRSFHASLEAEW
jgi:iron complex outermembrane receptor protein